MITNANYIYTAKGFYTVQEYIDSLVLNEAPKVFSFNEDTLEYILSPIDEVEESTTLINTFEVKFSDVYSSRNIIVNVGEEAEILQYNIIHTEKFPILDKKFQIIKYLEANKTNERIHFGWKKITTLFNYSNKCPNITLGDTLVKFVNRILIEPEKIYSFKFEGNTIPIFTSLTKTTHSNFILLK